MLLKFAFGVLIVLAVIGVMAALDIIVLNNKTACRFIDRHFPVLDDYKADIDPEELDETGNYLK